MASYTSPPIPTAALRNAEAAELVFSGVEMARQSFEGRVFLNNPEADEHTPQTPETGYAGTYHVYAYGDPPPPAIADALRRHVPGSGPVAPIETRVRVTAGTLRAALEDADEMTVTVVPVPATGALPDRPFETVDIVVEPRTYRRRAATD